MTPINFSRHMLLAAVLVSATTLSSLLLAGNSEVDQRLGILLRVLTYDRQIENRITDGVLRITVSFDPAVSSTKVEQEEMLGALNRLAALKVKGYTLRFDSLALTDNTDIAGELASRRTSALYVTSGLAPRIASITQATRQIKIASISADHQLAQKGVSVAVVAGGDKSKIIVNLPAAKAEGLEFSAALLRLAEIIH